VHPDGTSAAELGLAEAPTPAPPADPARLLALVQALAADPELRDSHALRARDYAGTRLTPTAAFAALDAILHRSFARPAPAVHPSEKFRTGGSCRALY